MDSGNNAVTRKKTVNVRKIAMTGVLAAVSTVLMFLSFNVPLMPTFIKMDFSELPALIASFSLGPLSGMFVCLIKNLVNVTMTTTGGVGEISNFILGVCFVVPAGFIYKNMKSRKGAVVGSFVGAVVMAVVSVFSNYYIVYPVYTMFMPMDTIIGMYRLINPNIENLWDCLIFFNMPFTFIKGMCDVGICLLIYKKLSPIIKNA